MKPTITTTQKSAAPVEGDGDWGLCSDCDSGVWGGCTGGAVFVVFGSEVPDVVGAAAGADELECLSAVRSEIAVYSSRDGTPVVGIPWSR